MATKRERSRKSLAPDQRIAQSIFPIRGQNVMLDVDLARLYKVQAKALNQAVRRNRKRFPQDFMFQLTWEEAEILRSQNVILSQNRPHNSRSQNVTLNQDRPRNLRSQNVTLSWGAHIKYRPYAFTEQGVAMLSSVLRSPRAVQVNIEIMRAFVVC